MKRLALLAAILFACVTLTYAQFTFTSIDCPGAERTRTQGINNNGYIAGSTKYPGDVLHAVRIKKGKCTPLAPTTILGTNWSAAFKINNLGDVVGWVIGDDGYTHGFLLHKGVLTILDFPGATDTMPLGINDSGTISGGWDLYDAGGNYISSSGFIWNNGNFTDVNMPGAADTGVLGINASGDFVGWWDTATTAGAFVFSKGQGQFTIFDLPFPGVSSTQPDDINNFGYIVGLYFDDSGVEHGFLKTGAAFTSIDHPGAAGLTSAWGINSVGQMVGNWLDSSGNLHGWLAQLNNQGEQ